MEKQEARNVAALISVLPEDLLCRIGDELDETSAANFSMCSKHLHKGLKGYVAERKHSRETVVDWLEKQARFFHYRSPDEHVWGVDIRGVGRLTCQDDLCLPSTLEDEEHLTVDFSYSPADGQSSLKEDGKFTFIPLTDFPLSYVRWWMHEVPEYLAACPQLGQFCRRGGELPDMMEVLVAVGFVEAIAEVRFHVLPGMLKEGLEYLRGPEGPHVADLAELPVEWYTDLPDFAHWWIDRHDLRIEDYRTAEETHAMGEEFVKWCHRWLGPQPSCNYAEGTYWSDSSDSDDDF